MIIKTPMPINCVECDNRGIRGIVDCKLIYSGCANCGRHPNCPLKDDSEMRVDDILEILEKYKLRIPPNVFYELKADICNHEEYKEPTTKKDLAVEADDCISLAEVRKAINRYIEKAQSSGVVDAFISFEELAIKALPSVYPKCDKPSGKWIPVTEIQNMRKEMSTISRVTDGERDILFTCLAMIDDLIEGYFEEQQGENT